MRPASRRMTAVLLAVLALVVLPQATAQASIISRATHYEVAFLANNPNPGMPAHCMPPRVIQVANAHYLWGQYWGGTEEWVNLDIQLGVGAGMTTYTWGDCLYPQNGYYRHVSSLDPADDEHPDWPTAYIEVNKIMPKWVGYPCQNNPPVCYLDRNVTWGSFLDRKSED